MDALPPSPASFTLEAEGPLFLLYTVLLLLEVDYFFN